jgi:hypothetical protein
VWGNNGGGIDNEGALTLNSSSVEFVSSREGFGAPLMITNSTLGKVIATEGLTLTYSTVVGEGLRLRGEAEVVLTGSIVDGDCGCGAFVPADCSDYVTSNGHNIESPGDTCGFDDPTDQVSVTAEQLNLGPLQDNGGPTMTHALLPGSFAIDQIPAEYCVDADGAALTTGQRGEPRPETGGTMCDVGAFELQP